MTLAGSTAPESDPQLWDRFLKVLQYQDIDQRYWRWYVLRVEQYLKAHRDKPLDQHTGHEVTAYLRGNRQNQPAQGVAISSAGRGD